MDTMANEDGLISCELDDLMRLYKGGQAEAIQQVGRQVAEWLHPMVDDAESKWKRGNIGDGVEIGEYMVLASLCSLMLDYLRNDRTGKNNKKHHEACVLHDIV